MKTQITVTELEKYLLQRRKYRNALRKISVSKSGCMCGAIEPSRLVCKYNGSEHAISCPIIIAARVLKKNVGINIGCILALLFLCSNVLGFNIEPGQKLPQHITYSCPDSQLDYVCKGLTQWNLACDNTFTFERVSIDATVQINLVDTLASNLLGLTTQQGNTALIQVVQNQNPYSVMLHELGHAFGLLHTEDVNAIMYQSAGFLSYLDQDDVDGIRTIYNLSPKILSMVVSVKGHNVKALYKQAGQYIVSDGFIHSGRRLIHKLPTGVFTIKMCSNPYMIVKEVTVK